MSWIKNGGTAGGSGGILPFLQYPDPVFQFPSEAYDFVQYCRTNKYTGWHALPVTPIDSFEVVSEDYQTVKVKNGLLSYEMHGCESVETAFANRPVSANRRVAGSVHSVDSVYSGANNKVGGKNRTCLISSNYYLYVISSLGKEQITDFFGGFSNHFQWSIGKTQIRRNNTWMSSGSGEGIYVNGIPFNADFIPSLGGHGSQGFVYNTPFSANFRFGFVNTAKGLFDFGEGYENAVPELVAPARMPDYSKQWRIQWEWDERSNLAVNFKHFNMPSFAWNQPFKNEKIIVMLILDYTGYKQINTPNYPLGI